MYLIKRKGDNHFSYAYEPTDLVTIINTPAFQGSSYVKNQVVTVVQGRPRHMDRVNIKPYSYLVQGNKSKDYPLQVAAFEITPAIKPSKEVYTILIAEWQKHQMIRLLKRSTS